MNKKLLNIRHMMEVFEFLSVLALYFIVNVNSSTLEWGDISCKPRPVLIRTHREPLAPYWIQVFRCTGGVPELPGEHCVVKENKNRKIKSANGKTFDSKYNHTECRMGCACRSKDCKVADITPVTCPEEMQWNIHTCRCEPCKRGTQWNYDRCKPVPVYEENMIGSSSSESNRSNKDGPCISTAAFIMSIVAVILVMGFFVLCLSKAYAKYTEEAVPITIGRQISETIRRHLSREDETIILVEENNE